MTAQRIADVLMAVALITLAVAIVVGAWLGMWALS